MIYRKLKNLQVDLSDTKKLIPPDLEPFLFVLLTFQLHTQALPKADWAACNVADQADLESRCLVCFPIATGFGGLTLRKGRMHFFKKKIYQVACYLSAEETNILQELMYKNLLHAPVSSMP